MLPEITLSTGVIAWITALITIGIGMAVRDMLTTFVSGLLFYFNRQFNEGDVVYLDGEKAIIVKIGMRQTVFGVENGRGYVWRYIYNDKIKSVKLEKLVHAHEHPDQDHGEEK